ncbi:MAG: 30S ribosomal protein S16, partial [Oligoflexia bacterium]|nr:30S ribosomal protein S16 [Oligoflexia bacterium]
MAVRLRLTRMGRKKRPFYRIVAADSRSPRDGRNLEFLGHYNPMVNPSEIKVNLERVDYWLSVGASPSDTVASLIKKARAAVAPVAPAAPVQD